MFRTQDSSQFDIIFIVFGQEFGELFSFSCIRVSFYHQVIDLFNDVHRFFLNL